MSNNKRKKGQPELIDFDNFAGFESPKMTDVPDELIDWFLPAFSGSELKVILYICRKTFGWKKDSDDISLSQLLSGVKTRDGEVVDRGTGLSKPALLKALRSLERNNLIIRERRRSIEKGDESTNFRLKIKSDNGEYGKKGSNKNNNTPRGKESLPGGGNQNSPRPVVKKATTQYYPNNGSNNVNVEETKTKTGFEKAITQEHLEGVTLQERGEGDIIKNEHLVDQIIEVCGDKQSRPFYRYLVKVCPSNLIHRNLGTVKDMKETNQIRKSPGALFTALMKKDAEDNGIDLKLKNNRTKER